jgi:hypothetical protein
MIVPTIGRVVWVTRGKSDQKEPALISYVWSDTVINVGGFNRDGVPFSHTSLRLVQDEAAPTDGTSYAEWMPYQKSVAR